MLVCAAPACAEDKCPPPPALTAPGGANIFTPEQEIELGDIEGEQIERNVRVIQDDKLSAHLNQIVDLLLAQLPPTQLHFRVTLIDLPVVNAFSLPGGRIYVSRKLVAFVHDDAELADLLGHEMGHILSHQGAIEMTLNFREVLGVTSVGDRKDIFDKFNRFMDNVARDRKVLERARNEEEPHQYEADRVALYTLADAGYSVRSFPDFFDRFAQTRGKTGGLITDIFGLTTPNQKRLREMRKSIEAMPTACRIQARAEPSDEFLAWQGTVIAYSGLGRQEVLSGVLDKMALDPPLRNDITNLRFSLDGKYVLAQDDASVFVLTREPLRLLFRADAPESHPAQFTPDSQAVVFDTQGMHVEEWSVPDRERTSVHELAIPGGCRETLLSPDGKTLSCVNREFDLSLYDVAQGNAVFTKKHFFAPESGYEEVWLSWTLIASLFEKSIQWVRMGYSPTGGAFIAASPFKSLALDVVNRQQIQLHGTLSGMVRGGFTFLSSNEVAAINRDDLKDSAILAFPSGDMVSRLPLGGQTLSAATHGDYLIAGPLKDFPVGLLSVSSHKFVFGSKDISALDAYDNLVLAQVRNGEIGLFDLQTQKVAVHAEISLSPLGPLRAAAVSPDLKWVAFSGDTRGAVWNLATGKRLSYTRSFHGAYFDGDTALLADFPKRDPQARSIARLDLGTGQIHQAPVNDEKAAVHQYGPFLLTRRAAEKGGSGTVLELSDVRDGKLLWTKVFKRGTPYAPYVSINPTAETVLLAWGAAEDAVKDEIKDDAQVQARLASLRDRPSSYLLEVLDAHTGAKKGAIAVDTGKGSFLLEKGYAAGDWVVMTDSDSRTLLYSLSTGQQSGVLFGTQSIVSPTGTTLATENESGRVAVYSLPVLEKRGELDFSSPVALWCFSDDGKRLFVLTKNQTAYTFDVSRITLPEARGSRLSAGSTQP